MRRALALLLALALTPAAAARPKRRGAQHPSPAAAPLAAPKSTVTTEPDGSRADLTGDGPLLGWAAPKNARGTRTIFVLIGPRTSEPADVSCGTEEVSSHPAAHDARLFRWSPRDPEPIALIHAGLPRGALEAADLDGDGRDELLLLADGSIDALSQEPSATGAAALRPLVRDAAIGTRYGDPRAARSAFDAADDRLRLSVSGEFVTYRSAPGGTAAPSAMLDLPVHVVPGRARIEVRTPEVVAIGSGRSKRMLFATAPEPAGGQRLHTLLLEPEAPAEERSLECWAQLPGPERLLDSALTLRDGRPVLVVTTMSAEKLSVFGEKMLRVFPLDGDRTRGGGSPQFVATTGLNLWQLGFISMTDLDRDGRDDLVIGYWKGLKRSIATLEVYRGEDGGAFAKARTTEIDVKDADEGFFSFGNDVDGDGRPDLVVVAAHEALVFPGAPAGDRGKRAVAGTPSRRLSIPPDAPGARPIDVSFELGSISVSRRAPGFGTPRPMDLDGDGRVELVFAGDLHGTARLGVLWFRAEGPSPTARLPLASPARVSYK
jgi:hypothetical protein